MQSRKMSFLEAISNTVVGALLSFSISQFAYLIAPFIQKWIWGGFVWELSVGSNLIMTAILTAVSIVRGYYIRRAFNKLRGE